MNIAFYAPLKAPDHPTPSGDRAMARALMAALRFGGHQVTLASVLRLYDGEGDADAQDNLMAQAEGEVARLLGLPEAATWRAWITYHNYYKAPDLIGPTIASALDIPYFQIESTRARKRLNGPWERFAMAAEAASDAAHAIFFFTHRDAETLERDAPHGQALCHLPPFLMRHDVPDSAPLDGAMLSVGMMRPGDKVASYQLIAETLHLLPSDLDWQLNIVGGGPAEGAVQALMAPFGSRVTMLGQFEPDALPGHYAQSALLFWPGVNEAFGISYLEAQAVGLPVVAQNRPGVRDVVYGAQPAPDAGPEAMAHRLTTLLQDKSLRVAQGQEAQQQIAARHLLPHAAATLSSAIEAAQ